ncbi:MAG: polysaccharide pyruvyl transferase family protein [Bacteroidaceae bacterium]|nr:polysaccharide pyruvyl transferase family protein [Bacteroidaceae bacterium]
MDDRINLIYWNENANFGDQLSPYIISKLSGKTVHHKIAAISGKNLIKYLLRYPHKLRTLKEYVLPFQKSILAVGSILSYGNSLSKIWGSGFMNETDLFYGGSVCAVRGKLSAEKIMKMGGHSCGVCGDPALLLPILYTPNVVNEYKIGIIPHWKEYDYFYKSYGSRYHIIDLRTTDVEFVIREILSCKKILSTSLHGIIVSHAYGIPALWIKHSSINTDGFKFRDYFSAVNIENYDGFSDLDVILSNERSINSFFEKNSQKTLPSCKLASIQKALLLAAPFHVETKWLKDCQ